MASQGVFVQQPVAPTAIELSESISDLEDPNAYPVKVRAVLDFSRHRDWEG